MNELSELGLEAGELVDYAVKPNFRNLGRRFGAGTPAVAAAITAVPAEDIATAVLAGGIAPVTVAGIPDGPVPVGADDVIVTQTPRAGWAVATDAGETVAIDTTVTPELRREGLAREVIRLVQDARKTDGLDVTDRIALRWSASEQDLAAALTEHAALIAGEVLATEYGPDVATPDTPEHAEPELGLRFWLRRAQLLRSLIRLVRQAGTARSAAGFPGGAASHLLQVPLAHEADEDAGGVVIPGDTGDHGYFEVGVEAGGFGPGRGVGLLRLLG